MRLAGLVGFAVLLTSVCVLRAGSDLNSDQLSMLKDSGGWEYVKMTDPDAGIQTAHTCFDGKPHPETCSGTLTLASDKKFSQNVYIHHQRVSRSGTYELNGDQLAFYDEFGTRDGPYTIQLDTVAKTLLIEMPQVKIEMELAKEYKKSLATQPVKK